MTIRIIDAAFETTATTGSGAYTLAGSQPGHQSFAAAGTGSKVVYQANDGTAAGVITQREVGIGTITITGGVTTLSRDAILYSTNSNSAVNWGAGTKNVIGSIAAAVLPTRDENLNFVEGFGAISGPANALALTLPVTPLAYSDGMQIAGYIATTNTAAGVTIAVNGLAVKALKYKGANPGIGNLVAGQLLVARYRVANDWFELIAPVPTPVIPVTKQPTRQYLTSGTAYTTPADCKTIIVRMVGGGGGGGGYGSGSNGGNGGDTTFNGVVAKGGNGGGLGNAGAPGAGGVNGTGTANYRQQGGAGFSAIQIASTGGASRLGPGSGHNVTPNTVGSAAIANGGGGGGGGGSGQVNVASAGGGGAGEYVELVINNPAANYTYSIGSAGTAGSGATNAGGAGGSGLIIVEEYY